MTGVGCVHALTALIALAPSSGKPLPVPGRGDFTLSLPVVWKETGRQTPGLDFPSVAFERSGTTRGSLEITLVWSPKNDPAFTQPESIRALAIAGQSAVRANAVEKEFLLRPIQGRAGQGFYYVATDRTYKLPASGVPVAGEYPILTHGELGLGTVVVSFTIFSDGKDDAAVQEALAAIRGATLAGTGR
jgi:hypothetical protein